MEKITINGVEYMLTPVENETVNKTEPKFKVGDWIVNRLGNIWHIDSFDAKNYQVTNTKGEHNYFPINIQDRMHLWTIADAKPGDVLATEPIDAYPSPFVAIYKIRRPDYFNSYCLIRFDGKFYEADTGHSIENIHPATKEQRDLLFQKMHEAGYEWDFEKKELKKIEAKEAMHDKPKFKVGDWIVFNGLVLFIKEVVQGYYRTISVGGIPNSYDWDIDNVARLWTIRDAKDGDVLSFYSEYKGNKMVQVGIIEKYVGKHGGCSNTFKIYVGVNWENNLQIGEYMGCSDIRPAAKEQRDTLMKAMTDAGCTFDFKKKELKKKQLLLSDVFDLELELEKTKEMNSTKWSEEDDYNLQCCIAKAFYDIQNGNVGRNNELIDWLKSLKNRVQPKQEWSEEEKGNVDIIVSRLEVDIEYWKSRSKRRIDEDKRVIDWLKSLRPQNTWKPSDEQIEALESATENCAYSEYQDCLRELIGQLKKLKE